VGDWLGRGAGGSLWRRRPLPLTLEVSGVRDHLRDLELPLGTRRTVRDDHGILAVLGILSHLGDPTARPPGDAPAFLASEQGGSLTGPIGEKMTCLGRLIGSAFANIRSCF
jgi:hypothetical protein